MSVIIAIDQGTTSSRAIAFDANMQIIASAQQEFTQYYPNSGYVEHDPGEIWSSVVKTCREVVDKAKIKPSDIAAIGITNQRETTLVWDKTTGRPVHPAIVWQDRRTADFCAELRQDGRDATVKKITGLLADPYFSGTKLKWILDRTEGARDRAQRKELLFGTVDTWLIWNLTQGAVHATDATNAARTMLYDIHQGCWSETMCDMLDIPMEMLPDVRDCAADFGVTGADIFGAEVPIYGVAGDQQAATLGQACFAPGMLKATYGTGCFALLNTGDTPVTSHNRLLTTIAYQLNGKPTYALEGSIFVAGAVVQWLRDGLQIIKSAGDTGDLALQADDKQNVVIVPAFVGLGAPYWHAECRGAVFGLTRGSGPAELARAALQSVGYQTRDLLEAMYADWQTHDAHSALRIDGGMAASDYAMQFLADMINAPTERPEVLETTATGVAWLAGHRAGLYPDADEFARHRPVERRFMPQMDSALREEKYAAWKRAVQATMTF